MVSQGDDERTTTTAGVWPLLRRVSHKPRFTNERVRFPPSGCDVLEGFELWLPEPFRVLPQSVVELTVDVRLDSVPVDLDFLVARFRWDPYRRTRA